MGRKRKKRRGRRGALGVTDKGGSKAERSLGFDFGCLPYAMALGSMDLPGLLGDASVVGVAYGAAHSQDLDAVVPTVGLLVEHPEPLREAFRMFHAWAERTDPDSLEVAIVFLKKGGYILGLQPEAERLTRRCLGYDRGHRPLLAMAAWFKPIDTVHPHLREFATYADRTVAPYLLDGLLLPRRVAAPASSDIIAIPDLKPLLKFEISFSEEDEVRPNTLAAMALQVARGAGPADTKAPPSPDDTPIDIATRRAGALRANFPVTLHRMARHTVREVFIDLGSVGVRPWQIEQALCNLTLSRSAPDGPHDSRASGAATETVTGLLSDYYEFADGSGIPSCNAAEVSAQVLADSNALLAHLRFSPARDIGQALKRLGEAGVLEATPANPELPAE